MAVAARIDGAHGQARRTKADRKTEKTRQKGCAASTSARGDIGPDAEAAVPTLIDLLKGNSSDMCWASARALGNLIATAIHSLILARFFLCHRSTMRFSLRIATTILHFNAPLVVAAILAMLMHEANHYFLRTWQSMEQVGVYSLAHKIGLAINTLRLL